MINYNKENYFQADNTYDFSKNTRNLKIFIKGKEKTKEISYIQKNDKTIAVKFHNNPILYNYKHDSILIKDEDNTLSINRAKEIMEYFYEETKSSSLKLENEDSSILQNYYDKITTISKETVLSAYLLKTPVIRNTINKYNIIYPFGVNLSQKKAVENTFSSNVSIIEGPPGTGKTQTILSIIANALISNESVAIVSNNNSAIENVEEKLKKYNLDFLTAFLGSSKNKSTFLENQKNFPDLNAWKQLNIEQTRNDLKERIIEIEQMLEYKNKLAKTIQLEQEYQLESQHFDTEHSQEKINKNLEKVLYFLSADKIFKLWNYCTNKNKIELSFWDKLFFIWNLKIYYPFIKNKNLLLETYSLQKIFYSRKLDELQYEIRKLRKLIENFNFDEKLEKICSLSLTFLKHNIYSKYKGGNRKTYSISDTYSISPRFIREYPIIFSTLYSIKNMCNNGFLFDYLIIDEASQADLLTGVLGMSCAKNIVVVGDLMQLPNVITEEAKKTSAEIWEKYDLDESYCFSKHSLLSSIIEIFSDAPRVLLQEHYRCHPKIINFCNKKFYDDNLVVMTSNKDENDTLSAIKTVKGNHAKNHINQRQIDIIKQEILPLIDKSSSIGIITPYRNQVKELRKNFDESIEIDTIHKFQGREKDIIIFSAVDNDISDFSDDSNLINVAVSRAVKKFYIVYSNNKNKQQSNIVDLVKYIEYNNFSSTSSKVISIFDLLYKQYTEERIKLLSKHRNFFSYPSEKLAYICIQEILKEDNIKSLNLAMHIPLKSFIKKNEELTSEEIDFIQRDSHADFLFYDKMNKSPLLVIEVDGDQYHNNIKQQQRDNTKNNILSKAGIKLLRLPTKGSMEKEKIKTALDSILEKV